MFGGLNRLLVAALVAGAFFLAPSAALACGGGPSAENVYKECLPSGGGGHAKGGGTTGGPTSTTPISSQTAKVIKHAGKDSRALATLARHNAGELQPSSQESETTPSAVGSAFDLGSGPTALLIALAVTALLLLGASGMRGWRRYHRG